MLEAAGFNDREALLPGLISALDSLRSYTEEGKRLYPEILLTTALERLVKPLAYNQVLRIGTAGVGDVFQKALKLCAPVARGDWAIWIDVGKSPTEFGVLSVMASELSPTLRTQVVGGLAVGDLSDPPTLYARAVGGRTELHGGGRQLIIAAGYAAIADATELASFVEHMTAEISADRRTIARAFFHRALEDSIREANGCMLAVIDDADQTLAQIKQRLPDGVYLDNPIDFMDLLRDADELRNRESSTRVRASLDLIKGMIGQDGITLFAADGRLLGFRLFVPITPGPNLLGGARRRAFAALQDLGVCAAVLAMSHDGNASYFEARDRERDF